MKLPAVFFLFLMASSSAFAAAHPVDEANRALSEGNFEAAVASLRMASKTLPPVGPDRAAIHLGLGIAHANLGRTALARRHFGRSAAADPSLSDAPVYRGVCLRLEGRTVEAVASFLEALRRDPDAPRAHDELWQSYKTLAEIHGYDEALLLREGYHLARTIELEPAYAKLVPEAVAELKYLSRTRAEAAQAPSRGARVRRPEGNLEVPVPALPADGLSDAQKRKALEDALR